MPSEKVDTMEYVYAALMLHKLKKEINEANISSIVKASGSEANEAKVKALVASLADVNIEEAIKAAPVAVAAAPAASGAGEAKKEGKKEAETPSAKSEEQAMEGLSSLFG
ncbi:MAG: 50S ribosomal protein P1 [Nitrosopumilaceae archaeon]|nr:50S ribosomal protein P1 [Nitrosopumilaceae archaeon]